MLTRGLVARALNSIGMALTDTLDDLISDGRINPQLAMKILGNFDQAITEALQKEVKSRLTFKVSFFAGRPFRSIALRIMRHSGMEADGGWGNRAASTRTASATRYGPF
ncbi:hypothetical protein IMZ48_14850 [Candidatus Bathyarchaeota archaeon]|nr:hypothetical protein [Candidatus Bathyarchaeota archaeon]